jgi:hypothetical protein
VKGVKFVGDGYTHCEGTVQGDIIGCGFGFYLIFYIC